jgi:hypothetical protein
MRGIDLIVRVRHKESGQTGFAIGHYVDGSGQLEIDVRWDDEVESEFVYVGELVFRRPACTAPLTTQQLMALHGWKGPMWDFVTAVPGTELHDAIYGRMRPTAELEGYKVYDPRDH